MPLPDPHKGESELTAAKLRSVLDYEPDTGIFRWKVKRIGRGKSNVGDIAGTSAPKGNRKVGLFRQRYEESRLAFLWMTGKWPPNLVDHINSDRSDNRWSNLRPANHSQNGANAKGRSLTGFKGVTIDRRRGRFKSQIKVNYQMINLGSFDTAEQAHAAYLVAAKSHFGEFARAK
jgi:hypothetical protein